MGVSAIEDEPVEPVTRLRLVPSAPDPRKPIDEQILQVMEKLALVLAVRFMLLLSVIGAFVLALIAMGAPSVMAISVMVIWCAATIGPLCWLAQKKT